MSCSRDLKTAKEALYPDDRAFVYTAEKPDGSETRVVAIILYTRTYPDWRTNKVDAYWWPGLGTGLEHETGASLERLALEWARPLFGDRAEVYLVREDDRVSLSLHVTPESAS